MTTDPFVAEYLTRKAQAEAEHRRAIEEAVKPIDDRIAARAEAQAQAEAARADAQKQAAQERAAAAEDIERRADLTAWLAAGGDEASHAVAWPGRWQRMVSDRADAKRRQAAQLTRAAWTG